MQKFKFQKFWLIFFSKNGPKINFFRKKSPNVEFFKKGGWLVGWLGLMGYFSACMLRKKISAYPVLQSDLFSRCRTVLGVAKGFFGVCVKLGKRWGSSSRPLKRPEQDTESYYYYFRPLKWPDEPHLSGLFKWQISLLTFGVLFKPEVVVVTFGVLFKLVPASSRSICLELSKLTFGQFDMCGKMPKSQNHWIHLWHILGGIWANVNPTWNPTTLIDVTWPKGATNTGWQYVFITWSTYHSNYRERRHHSNFRKRSPPPPCWPPSIFVSITQRLFSRSCFATICMPEMYSKPSL